MKKVNGLWLLVVACIFASGLVGYYIGRNTNRGSVDVSTLKPSQSQQTPADPTSNSETAPTEAPGPININTADLDQLQTLTGIGPTIAQRIIDYRTEHGPFGSVYDLLEVSGIGLVKLEAILDQITVGGES